MAPLDNLSYYFNSSGVNHDALLSNSQLGKEEEGCHPKRNNIYIGVMLNIYYIEKAV